MSDRKLEHSDLPKGWNVRVILTNPAGKQFEHQYETIRQANFERWSDSDEQTLRITGRVVITTLDSTSKTGWWGE